MIITCQNNVIQHDPELQPDEAVLVLGSPDYTTPPYDVYARFIVQNGQRAFQRAKISAKIHTCHRQRASVGIGSGPGGSVRFGDDMLPPEVVAVVKIVELERARHAWEDYTYRRYIRKPYSIVLNRYWDGAQWVKGGTWGRVVVNALIIARLTAKPTNKLKAYALKHPVIEK